MSCKRFSASLTLASPPGNVQPTNSALWLNSSMRWRTRRILALLLVSRYEGNGTGSLRQSWDMDAVTFSTCSAVSSGQPSSVLCLR